MDTRTGGMLLDRMAPAICGIAFSEHGPWPPSAKMDGQGLRRLLKGNLAKAQKRYLNGHEAYHVLDTDWFHGYFLQSETVDEIAAFALAGDLWKRADSIYVRELAAGARAYAKAWFGGISDLEELALRNFYRMLIRAARDTIRVLGGGYLLPLEGLAACGAGQSTAFGGEGYRAALTDGEKYRSLVGELLDLGGRDDWTRREFGKYPWEILEQRPDLRAVAWDFYLNSDEKSIREWMACLAGTHWEHYASFYISCRLRGNGREDVPEAVRAWSGRYYGKHIGSADIRGAIAWKTDSRMAYRRKAVGALVLFAEFFGYDMPKNKARELLFLCAYPGCGERKEWLPRRYLTEEEIREQVIMNMMTEDLKGDVLRWHIRYCMDRQIEACVPVIRKVAGDPTRNLWVRKDALACVCGRMGIREVCRDVLPGLRGELFFFVAESFWDTKSPELAELVWDYGERHPRQKLRCDICLTLMEDRRGVESLRRHIGRRKNMPSGPAASKLPEAVKGIRRADLADELEKLLRAAWKPGFRDNPDGSLLTAAGEGLAGIARGGAQGMETVMRIFGNLMETYGEDADKAARITGWIQSCRG